jgi:prepilin peptidase CpaA
MLTAMLLVVYGSVVIGAAASDAMTLRIPNAFPLVLVGLFGIQAFVTGMPFGAVLWHLLVGVLVLLAGMGLFAWNVIGGGDAKLAAAVFLWVGTTLFIPLLIFICLSGLVVAVMTYMLHERGFLQRGTMLPYGVAIAGGWLLVTFLPL